MLRISELGARHKVRYVSKNPSQPGRVSITYHLNVAQDGAGPRYISFGGEVTTWMAVGFAPAAFHFAALFGTPWHPTGWYGRILMGDDCTAVWRKNPMKWDVSA
jgi:hypothetical protein